MEVNNMCKPEKCEKNDVIQHKHSTVRGLLILLFVLWGLLFIAVAGLCSKQYRSELEYTEHNQTFNVNFTRYNEWNKYFQSRLDGQESLFRDKIFSLRADTYVAFEHVDKEMNKLVRENAKLKENIGEGRIELNKLIRWNENLEAENRKLRKSQSDLAFDVVEMWVRLGKLELKSSVINIYKTYNYVCKEVIEPKSKEPNSVCETNCVERPRVVGTIFKAVRRLLPFRR
jgi:hypothetical protein